MDFSAVLVCILLFETIGALPTGMKSVYEKIQESVQTKCLPLQSWFENEPGYLKQCPKFEEMEQVKDNASESNKDAFLCGLYYDYFDQLCKRNKTVEKQQVKAQSTQELCSKLLGFNASEGKKLSLSKCNALCFAYETEGVKPICSEMLQLSEADSRIPNVTNKAAVEKPVRSNSPAKLQSVQTVNVVQKPPTLVTAKLAGTVQEHQPVGMVKTEEVQEIAGQKAIHQDAIHQDAELITVKTEPSQEGDIRNNDYLEPVNIGLVQTDKELNKDGPKEVKPNNDAGAVEGSNNGQENVVESQGDANIKAAEPAEPARSPPQVDVKPQLPKVSDEEANNFDEDTQEELELEENIMPPKASNIEKIKPVLEKTKPPAEKVQKPIEIDKDEDLYPANFQNQDIDDGDSYFFSYFMMVCVTFIGCYVAYHNKQKILALVVEGRRGKRSSRARRPNSANYHKLDSNLEEAINSSCDKNTSQVIY